MRIRNRRRKKKRASSKPAPVEGGGGSRTYSRGEGRLVHGKLKEDEFTRKKIAIQLVQEG